MKFKLLSVGQKFEHEGETYVKTSPLIANNLKTGQSKMIPRYAVLTLLDEAGTQKQKINEDTVNSQETLTAFNHFYEKCMATLEDNNVLVPLIKDEIDKARDEFTQLFIKKT